MTLDNAAYFLAGVLVGFVIGLVVEYTQKANALGAGAEAKIERIDAEASAADKAVDEKTQSVIKETEGLAGQELADAINADLASPPVVPVLRSASDGQASPAGAGEPAVKPPLKPAG